MTYSLKIWTNPTKADDVRLYINGTNRSALFFTLQNGHVVCASKTSQTPPKFRTGDHWGKVNKDGDAARAVAEAFNAKLGDDSTAEDFERLLQIARDGIQVEG